MSEGMPLWQEMFRMQADIRIIAAAVEIAL
jgi:hypothetical protein